MVKGNINTSADMFLYKANVDLITAKYLLQSFQDGKIEIDLEIIMFHLQQCAEKLFKSLLSHAKIRILKMHDLSDLLDLLIENEVTIIKDVAVLLPLTEYAVEGRYAIIYDDLEDADKYIHKLDELLLFVQNTIQQ